MAAEQQGNKTVVQYDLPIKVIIIKNNTLGMIRWEQMAFLGNPGYGVELTPIDFAEFAESCGGRGYSITEPDEVRAIIGQAMAEKRPTIVEAVVDPLEPPMPPKVDRSLSPTLLSRLQRGSRTPGG
jgi:pyruvate dehydrogenase (quinone)